MAKQNPHWVHRNSEQDFSRHMNYTPIYHQEYINPKLLQNGPHQLTGRIGHIRSVSQELNLGSQRHFSPMIPNSPAHNLSASPAPALDSSPGLKFHGMLDSTNFYAPLSPYLEVQPNLHTPIDRTMGMNMQSYPPHSDEDPMLVISRNMGELEIQYLINKYHIRIQQAISLGQVRQDDDGTLFMTHDKNYSTLPAFLKRIDSILTKPRTQRNASLVNEVQHIQLRAVSQPPSLTHRTPESSNFSMSRLAQNTEYSDSSNQNVGHNKFQDNINMKRQLNTEKDLEPDDHYATKRSKYQADIVDAPKNFVSPAFDRNLPAIQELTGKHNDQELYSSQIENAQKAPEVEQNLNEENVEPLIFNKPKFMTKKITMGILHGWAHCHHLPEHGTVGKKAKSLPQIPVSISYSGSSSKYIFRLKDGQYKTFADLDMKTGEFLFFAMNECDGAFKLKHQNAQLQERNNDISEKLSGNRYTAKIAITIQINVAHQVYHKVANILKRLHLKLDRPTKGLTLEEYKTQMLEIEDRKALQGEKINYDELYLDRLDIVTDEVNDFCLKFPQSEQPKSIKTELYAHQLQALWFMTEREKSPHNKDSPMAETLQIWDKVRDESGKPIYRHKAVDLEYRSPQNDTRGGIIADVMGLGKTLTLISLIASSSESASRFAAGQKQQDAKSNPIQTQATLVIAKTSILDATWAREIKEHRTSEEKLSFVRFYNNERPNEFGRHDIVLTTYETLSREYNKHSDRSSRFNSYKSPLFIHEFYRVVCDEAHFIRNPSTQTFKACFAVNAKRRWAATGTPLQNKLEDLGALLQYLHSPILGNAKRFEKHISIPCMTADEVAWRSVRVLLKILCIRREKDVLKKQLPIKDTTEYPVYLLSDHKQDYEILFNFEKKMVDDHIQDWSHIKNKRIHIFTCITRLRLCATHGRQILGPNENRLFDQQGKPATDGNDSDSEEEMSKKTTEQNMFEWLNIDYQMDPECRLCHNTIDFPENSREEISQDADPTLCYCHKECCYKLCCNCYMKFKETAHYIDDTDSYFCVRCEKVHDINNLMPIDRARWKKYLKIEERIREKSNIGKLRIDYSGPSIKVKHLLDELNKLSEASRQLGLDKLNKPFRSVVFSEWTRHLDLIQIALENNNIGFARIDGTLNSKQRSKAIEKFETDPDCRVFLISIKAGGFGLNLVVANYVFIMEPQWNPQAEKQAIDRVHRIGQTRKVYVCRYIAQDTIEVHVDEIAKRKEFLADMIHAGSMTKQDGDSMMEVLQNMFKRKGKDEKSELTH